MEDKFKLKKIAFLTIALILISAIFYLIKSNSAEKKELRLDREIEQISESNNAAINNKTDKKLDLPPVITNLSENKKLSPAHQKNCLTFQEALELDEKSGSKKWLNENINNEQKAYYVYADEKLLLSDAGNGDAKAMWALGKNYLWNAKYTNFHFDSLDIGYGDPSNSWFKYNERQKRNKWDNQFLEKAQFWFYKAALNNDLGALHELSYSQRDVPTKIAYQKLSDWVAPDYLAVFGSIVAASGKKLSPTEEQFKQAEPIFEKLKLEWIEQRNKLKRGNKIRFDIPDEVINFHKKPLELCGSIEAID